MSTLNDIERRALAYILNTNHSATVAAFDEDHEPIGPMLREKLVPVFMRPHPETQRLILTERGMVIAMEVKYGRR